MKLIFKLPLSAALTVATFSGVSLAHDWYAGGSVSWMQQADSDNSGQFDTGFQGGTVDGVNPGPAFTAGTPLAFDSDFDDGYAVSGEVGARFNNGLRGSLELSFTDADVDSHANLTVGGADVGAIDANALVVSPSPLGVAIDDVLADGRGNVQNTAVMANVYYDFDTGTALEPYVGAGIGVSQVNVDFEPAGVSVIEDDSTEFAYQIKAGATYQLNDRWEAFGEYTYRATDDIELDSALLPATIEIENQQQMLGVGLRYRFGG